MNKAVVSEAAIRELLIEALGNVGAMGHDAPSPIEPNAVIDRPSMELDFDPIEVKALPRSRTELIVMVRNLLDGVEDDQSGELYKKIKNLVGGDEAGKKDFAKAAEAPSIATDGTDRSKNMGENKLVETIRNIVEETLSEALPFGFGKGKMKLGGQFETGEEDDFEGPPEPDFVMLGGSMDDEFKKDGSLNFDPNEDIIFDDEKEAHLAKMTKSVWDPEDEEDEDEKPVAAKGSPKKRVDLGTGYGVDGDTFEKIGEKLGFTPEAAKKAVATAMERFKVLHNMDPDDLEDMVLTGVDEYVDMLAKTGEMNDEEESFMRSHPEHVTASETFREFFSKYVKRAAREDRADSQDSND